MTQFLFQQITTVYMLGKLFTARKISKTSIIYSHAARLYCEHNDVIITLSHNVLRLFGGTNDTHSRIWWQKLVPKNCASFVNRHCVSCFFAQYKFCFWYQNLHRRECKFVL